MTDQPDVVPPGLADLPLEVRNAHDVERQREIGEGMTRRHLAIAAQERANLAHHFARVLRMGQGKG